MQVSNILPTASRYGSAKNAFFSRPHHAFEPFSQCVPVFWGLVQLAVNLYNRSSIIVPVTSRLDLSYASFHISIFFIEERPICTAGAVIT